MTTTTKMTAVAILMATIMAPTFAAADRSANPERCKAKVLRKEARAFDCASNCEDRFENKNDPAGLKACKEGCMTRCDAATKKLESRWPCQAIVTAPDPLRCASQLMMAESDKYDCQANCGQRNPTPEDLKSCKSDCDTTYETKKDQIQATPICKNGPAKHVP